MLPYFSCLLTASTAGITRCHPLFLVVLGTLVSIATMLTAPKGIAQDLAPEREQLMMDLENQMKNHQRAIAQLMREATRKGVDFMSSLPDGTPQQEAVRRDYIMAEARLYALTARYEATKKFDPESREIPQIVIDNAIRNDPDVVQLQSLIDSLTVRIESRAKTVSTNDVTLREMNVQLREAKEKLGLLEETLKTTTKREFQDNLKTQAQDNLREIEAEMERLGDVAAKLAVKVMQQKDEIPDQTEAIEGNISSWNQVLFDERQKLLRLKAELAISKRELGETVVYSEEEVEEYLNNRCAPTPSAGREGVLREMEAARKASLRRSIREIERTIRMSEMMIEELKKVGSG